MHDIFRALSQNISFSRIGKKRLKIPKPVIKIRKSEDRTDNTMTKRKRDKSTNSDLQNFTEKTNYRATLKPGGIS